MSDKSDEEFWRSEAKILAATFRDIIEAIGPPVDSEPEAIRFVRAAAGHALQDLSVREGLRRRGA